MPLLDHFHAPLHPGRKWESLHAAWAVGLAETLNQRWLPKEYYAEVQTHARAPVEIDVATYEGVQAAAGSSAGDGIATLTLPAPAWAPPAPALIMPAVFPDTFAVRVFGAEPEGLELVAAIELVSPGNKDRPEARRAFAIKCASYLCQGVHLLVMDIVTNRRANLHNEMVQLLEASESLHLPAVPALYAVAYRAVRRKEKDEIDLWPACFAVGDRLPLLPLALNPELCVPVDFEATYTEACRRLRLV
jgi:hypothetical protein